MDTTAAGGPVSITETCVYLEAHGLVYLLLWAEDQVTWHADSRTITFRNSPWNDDGNVVTIKDGDHIVVGGSGGSEDAGAESSRLPVERLDWVAPPHASCDLGTWWGVGAVSTQGS